MIADGLKPATVPTFVLAVKPLLVGSELAGRLCGVSGRTWTRMAAASEVPHPVRLGRLRRWRVDELKRWVSAGCPSQARWESRREVTNAPP